MNYLKLFPLVIPFSWHRRVLMTSGNVTKSGQRSQLERLPSLRPPAQLIDISLYSAQDEMARYAHRIFPAKEWALHVH